MSMEAAARQARRPRGLSAPHLAHLDGNRQSLPDADSLGRNAACALPLVGAGRPRRPAAAPLGAQPDRRGRCAASSRRAASSRSRPAASRSRPATRRICTPSRPRRSAPDGRARAALPPHLAGIRLQEAARRRRARASSRFAQVCRNRERGPLHHPEFTMLEWYRAGEPYEALMARLRRRSSPLAAEAAGTRTARLPRTPRRPIPPSPSGSPSPRPSTRFAGIDLLATVAPDGATDRDALSPGRRGAALRHRRRTTPGPTSSAASSSRGSSPSSAGAAPRSSTNTRSPRRRSRGRPAHDPRRRRAVRALCLRGRARQRASANSPTPAEQRRRFEAEMAREGAGLRRALPARRGFPRRARPSCRRRAASRSASTGWSCWRPAPSASRRCCGRRCRRPEIGPHGAGASADGAHRMQRGPARTWSRISTHDRPPRGAPPTSSRPASCRPSSLAGAATRVAARYAVAITPGDGGADRPRRPARPDRAPVRARPAPSSTTRPRSAPTRSATRPTARSRASSTAIRTGCC